MTGLLMLLMLSYWPLPANYGITGTFMEYRNQHLHAGFDLSTDGKVGLPVRCFDNGNIVLIKVQKRGYGRVLYIRHPKQKLISVYGHLDRFTPRLEKLVSRYRKLRHTRYPGTIVPRHPIPVQKGQVIAYSGESGVGWPHLHFELRNLNNEPINPTEFGLSVTGDISAPEFQFLNIYPETPSSTINGNCASARFPIKRTKEGVFTTRPFSITGPVLMSVTIRDTDGRKGPLSIHDIKATLNRHPFYRYHADSFSYNRFKRSSAVYDLGRTRLTPSSYSFNLFRIPGSNLLSQEEFPATFQKGLNRMHIYTIDFNQHKAEFEFTFKWQKVSGKLIHPTTFTSSALLLGKHIVSAGAIEYPVFVRISDHTWTAAPYNTVPAVIELGDISLKATGYNTSPRLVYTRQLTSLHHETGLKAIPDTGIEIQPGLVFFSQLDLAFHWKKSDPRIGWFRYDTVKKKWKYRKTELNNAQNSATAKDFRSGRYAVFLDTAAPVIHKNPYFFRERVAWHITDIGKGIDDSSILISRGKQSWKMEYDPDRKIAWTDQTLKKGRYKICVTDLAGNRSSAVGRLR